MIKKDRRIRQSERILRDKNVANSLCPCVGLLTIHLFVLFSLSSVLFFSVPSHFLAFYRSHILVPCTVSILKNLHARMVSLEGLKFVRYTYPLESSTHLVRPTNWIKIKSIGARRGKLNSLWKPPGIELTTLELKTLGWSVIGMKSCAG